MIKGFLFALLMLFSLDVYAQARVRKVPFLPYLGTGGSSSGGKTDSPSQNQGGRTIKIAFKKGSSHLGHTAKAALKRIADRCTGQIIFIKAFYSRSVTEELATRRQEAVFNALKDLNIPGLIERPMPEFRDDSSSAVNTNQVIVTY